MLVQVQEFEQRAESTPELVVVRLRAVSMPEATESGAARPQVAPMPEVVPRRE
jgi:hypothetical protein